jgi:hypothetical protein
MKEQAQPPTGGAETLADLEAEAAARAAPPPPDAEPMEGEAIPPVSDGLVLACSTVAAVVGGIICARAGAAPLTQPEARGLGEALAGVAVFYLPADGDPRIMAWATLALAVAAVAAPRMGKGRDDAAAVVQA